MKHSRPAEQSITSAVSGAFVRRAVYPLWLRRDHPSTPRYWREFERSQYLAHDQIVALQFERLRKLLMHANAQCEFYRERFESAGIKPAEVRSFEELAAIPRLTKLDIQNNQRGLLANEFPEKARVRNQTGGSTGSPLQFWVDRERFDSRLASTLRHNSWTGLRPGDWCAQLWGARLDQIVTPGLKSKLKNHLLYRIVELNTAKIEDADWVKFVAQLRSKRPRYMVAYARSAVLFARYVEEQKLSDIKFDSIITTAEVLMPEERTLLERVFAAKVFNRYGCREVSVIASECEHHTGLHVNSDALLVEIVREDGDAGRSGRVLVTDLLNFSMPLIRYEIGDMAQWSEITTCPCGRGLPLLESIQGRTTDFLVLADGRRISGPALTLIVADMPDVRQVQFVQSERQSVLLKVVPGNGYSPDTVRQLRERLSHYLGTVTRLEIAEVAEIPSEASGKYRFVVSTLEAPAMEDQHVSP